jgi:hypothetical protein
MFRKEGECMPSMITTQQVSEKFELLDPPQKQTVYEFILFLLSKPRGHTISEDKQILLHTTVWTERDIQRIHEVQQDMTTWHIPTLS